MQQVTNQELVNRTVKLKLGWLAPVLLLISVATTLVAIFAIEQWVEMSGWHHAAQHVMIFSSGAVAGGSLLSIFKTKKEN
jgi:hypothetical protein